MHYIIYVLLGAGFLTLYLTSRPKPEDMLDFFKHSTIRFYFQTWMVCFAVVGFIFGIHDGIISSFDNKYLNRYNWFDSRNVLQFPVDHYRMQKSEGNIIPSIIDYEKLEVYKGTKPEPDELLIVDKTNSASGDFLGAKKIRDELLGTMKSKFEITDNDSIELNDAVILFAVYNFYNANHGKRLSAHMYLGNNKFVDLLSTGENFVPKWHLVDTMKTGDILLRCWNTFLKSNHKKGYTNFGDIFHHIGNNLFADLQAKNVKLTLVSDFLQQAPILSVNDLTLHFKEFYNKHGAKIDQMNFIVYPNIYKEDPTYSLKVNQLVGRLRVYFADNINLYEISMHDLHEDKGCEKLRHVCCRTIDFRDSIPFERNCVIFYKPYPSLNSINQSKALVEVKGNESHQYYFCFRTNAFYSDENMSFTYHKNSQQNASSTILMLNSPEPLPEINKQYVFHLNSSVGVTDGHEYFLEISKGNSIKYRLPVVFRDILPKTSCFWLIVMYCISFLCIFLIQFFMFQEIYANLNSYSYSIPMKWAGLILWVLGSGISGVIWFIYSILALLELEFGGFIFVGVIVAAFLFGLLGYSVEHHIFKNLSPCPPINPPTSSGPDMPT